VHVRGSQYGTPTARGTSANRGTNSRSSVHWGPQISLWLMGDGTDANPGLPLVGRHHELAQAQALLERLPVQGGGIVVSGEPGIGKTAILSSTGDWARRHGLLVLTVNGTESEANLSFAGLHRLIRPLLKRAPNLPERQRDALLGAFGMARSTVPDLFLIGLGTLELVSRAAAEQPVVAIVDDAQWLDDPTSEVLTFMARRLQSEQIALIVAVRDGYQSALLHSGLPDVALEGLAEPDAVKLLDRGTELDGRTQELVLSYARGNPLALLELPTTVGRITRESPGPASAMPLTKRLERAFSDRAERLPGPTRSLLLVAAVNDGDELGESLLAASLLEDQELSVEDAEPALDARLVSIEGSRMWFRHPLVRSALYQQASETARRSAHHVLARSIAGPPSRRSWHRARAVVGYDEDVADEMVAVAGQARQRGGIRAAISAQERAAELTRDPARRANRLLVGAEMAFEHGSHELVGRLLGQADLLGLGPSERRRATWVREMFQDGTPGDAPRIGLLIEEAGRAAADGDSDLGLNLLLGAALRSWWADPGTDAKKRLVEAASIMADGDDPRLLVVFATTAPRERGDAVIEALARARTQDLDDANVMRLLGMAARALGEFDYALTFLQSAADGLRAQGRLALLAQALCMQAHAAIEVGDFDLVLTTADESRRLAEETSQPNWLAGALTAEGTVAAVRGEIDRAERFANDAEQILLPRRVSNMLAVVQSLRTTTALSAGRYEDAFSRVIRIFDPTDIAHHQRELFAAVSFMAEAAARCGRTDDAVAIVDGLEPVAKMTPSPQLRLGMDFAQAVLADDTEAELLYRAALAAHFRRCPFHEARLKLSYGSWLRRQRKLRDSRVPLREARDFFETQSLTPWADRARHELRASGQASGPLDTHRAQVARRAQLSPQELQIARLAAAGLTNQQIGERLFLSHRTVGSHLYRIFPKLDITSRMQLRDALGNDETLS
jgi:DNA-binding CsgD family transcriptional regulator